jgi:NADPH-dependent 2,4-dienoyl-CoA reductase/sulfur reductase-like enzyme
MEIRHQVIVVGAGPAGLNAAKYAANSGCDVALIDAGNKLGGQYWRHTGNEHFDQSVHHNFDKASLLMDAVKSNPRITIYSQSSIWSASVIANQIVLRVQSGAFFTSKLILATGAYDRSIPFPGWDIPGVMTAGAAQSLLKGSGVIAGKKIVVAGSGPFLLPVASGLSSHSGKVVRVVEASSKFAWKRGTFALFQNPAKIVEGLSYLITLRNHKVVIGYREAIVEAHADIDGLLNAVTVAKIDSNFEIQSTFTLTCDVAAISWGFTPDTSLAAALDVTQVVDIDGAIIVKVNDEQRASCPHPDIQIFAAGEITGIGGSDSALLEGAIAGLAAAGSTANMKKLKSLRRRALSFSSTLQKVYGISIGWKNWLTPETIICRCEEVNYQQVTHAANDLGASDSRGIKLMTRCGMGMCQGRICSRIVADLLSSDKSDRIKGVIRPIITPITLGELAQEGLL